MFNSGRRRLYNKIKDSNYISIKYFVPSVGFKFFVYFLRQSDLRGQFIRRYVYGHPTTKQVSQASGLGTIQWPAAPRVYIVAA